MVGIGAESCGLEGAGEILGGERGSPWESPLGDCWSNIPPLVMNLLPIIIRPEENHTQSHPLSTLP
jgi:hypothetical protein